MHDYNHIRLLLELYDTQNKDYGIPEEFKQITQENIDLFRTYDDFTLWINYLRYNHSKLYLTKKFIKQLPNIFNKSFVLTVLCNLAQPAAKQQIKLLEFFKELSFNDISATKAARILILYNYFITENAKKIYTENDKFKIYSLYEIFNEYNIKTLLNFNNPYTCYIIYDYMEYKEKNNEKSLPYITREFIINLCNSLKYNIDGDIDKLIKLSFALLRNEKLENEYQLRIIIALRGYYLNNLQREIIEEKYKQLKEYYASTYTIKELYLFVDITNDINALNIDFIFENIHEKDKENISSIYNYIYMIVIENIRKSNKYKKLCQEMIFNKLKYLIVECNSKINKSISADINYLKNNHENTPSVDRELIKIITKIYNLKVYDEKINNLCSFFMKYHPKEFTKIIIKYQVKFNDEVISINKISKVNIHLADSLMRYYGIKNPNEIYNKIN